MFGRTPPRAPMACEAPRPCAWLCARGSAASGTPSCKHKSGRARRGARCRSKTQSAFAAGSTLTGELSECLARLSECLARLRQQR
eukprot:5307886-Pleurochrysis_carterae.AAC.1